MPAGRLQRAQNAVLIADEGEDFLLVEPVIAGGDAIDAQREHFVGHAARDAETAGQIFAVHHDEIEFERILQPRQFGRHHFAARTPHDVADEEKTHVYPKLFSDAVSVTTISSRLIVCIVGHAVNFLTGIRDADGGDVAALSRRRPACGRNSRRHSRCDSRVASNASSGTSSTRGSATGQSADGSGMPKAPGFRIWPSCQR